MTLEYSGEIQRVVIPAENGNVLNGGQPLLYQCTGVLDSQGADIIIYSYFKFLLERGGYIFGMIVKLESDLFKIKITARKAFVNEVSDLMRRVVRDMWIIG